MPESKGGFENSLAWLIGVDAGLGSSNFELQVSNTVQAHEFWDPMRVSSESETIDSLRHGKVCMRGCEYRGRGPELGVPRQDAPRDRVVFWRGRSCPDSSSFLIAC